MLSRYKGLDISNVLLFSSVFNFALPFILDISSYLTISKIHKTSIDKVLDLLELEKENLKTTRLTTIKKVEFKNINFSYDDTQLIKNFNYEYKKERLMIVGESGSGKSTLIKLLLRFLKLNEGEILIDNININYLDLDFIRSNITYVSQNEVLFNDTILNNLSIVNKDIGKIKKVCEIVRLKHDLNYLILDDASNISGGERKKIIIARALLKVKNILILDESFNEVGIDEEKKILTNIFDEYKNLGVIYISHRNSNKNLFDKTLCIGGKIARSRT